LILIFTVFYSESPAQTIDALTFYELGKKYENCSEDFLAYSNYLNYYFVGNDSSKQFESGIKSVYLGLKNDKIPESTALILDMKKKFPTLTALDYDYFYLLKISNKEPDALMFGKQLSTADSLTDRLTYLKAASYLYNNQPLASCGELVCISRDFKYYDQSQQIYNSLNKPEFKQKSLLLAAGASIILPGAGQVYSGFLFDGMTIFGYNLVTGAAAYSSWRYELDREHSKRNYFFPVSLSAICGVTYLLNIYNAANSAQKANLFYQNQFYKELLNNFEISIKDDRYFFQKSFNLQILK